MFFVYSVLIVQWSVVLCLQVRNCSAVTCATPPSPQRAAWRSTCASTPAPSLSNAPSASFASEPRATVKPTSSVTFAQTATAAKASAPLPLWVIQDTVRTRPLGRMGPPVRASNQPLRNHFNLWVCYRPPALIPTFTSQPIRFWLGSLTRTCCSRALWVRLSCLPLCQVGVVEVIWTMNAPYKQYEVKESWLYPLQFSRVSASY